jgi:hypothetical protein
VSRPAPSTTYCRHAVGHRACERVLGAAAAGDEEQAQRATEAGVEAPWDRPDRLGAARADDAQRDGIVEHERPIEHLVRGAAHGDAERGAARLIRLHRGAARRGRGLAPVAAQRRRAPGDPQHREHAADAAGHDRERRAERLRHEAGLELAELRPAMKNIMLTLVIRPRIASGVASWRTRFRITTLTVSATPVTARQRNVNTKFRDRPNATVAAP